jgi:hypothetical protein
LVRRRFRTGRRNRGLGWRKRGGRDNEKDEEGGEEGPERGKEQEGRLAFETAPAATINSITSRNRGLREAWRAQGGLFGAKGGDDDM